MKIISPILLGFLIVISNISFAASNDNAVCKVQGAVIKASYNYKLTSKEFV
jgi:hypothetical protein